MIGRLGPLARRSLPESGSTSATEGIRAGSSLIAGMGCEGGGHGIGTGRDAAGARQPVVKPSAGMRRALAAAAVAAWLPATACTPSGPPPPAEPSATEPSPSTPADSATGTDVVAQGPLEFGDWAVIGHRMPGTSAMSEAEAAAWNGRVARYGVELAAFGAETCYRPSYQARSVRGDSLLQVGYQASPSALGIAPRSVVTMIEVRCGASAWIGAGGTLLRLPDGTTFMVWDGTFFELRLKTPEGGS
jgi:hypothetical protein